MRIKVSILGASGRVGQLLVHDIRLSNEFALVEPKEKVFQHIQGSTVHRPEKDTEQYAAYISEMIAQSDVCVDFSHFSVLDLHLEKCSKYNVPLVIGTTGLKDKQHQLMTNYSKSMPVLYSPNMAVGVNAMFHILATAASLVGRESEIEIKEVHHKHKQDAPSGTAIKMGEIIAGKMGRNFEEVARYEGQRSITREDQAEIRFHALRAGDVVGEHTATFFMGSERIEITHKASSRNIYAQGALKAAKWLIKQPAGLYNMQDVLNTN